MHAATPRKWFLVLLFLQSELSQQYKGCGTNTHTLHPSFNCHSPTKSMHFLDIVNQGLVLWMRDCDGWTLWKSHLIFHLMISSTDSNIHTCVEKLVMSVFNYHIQHLTFSAFSKELCNLMTSLVGIVCGCVMLFNIIFTKLMRAVATLRPVLALTS